MSHFYLTNAKNIIRQMITFANARIQTMLIRTIKNKIPIKAHALLLLIK